MGKKEKKYNPKPRNEFEKGLFKYFEKDYSLKKLDKKHFEIWKKENTKWKDYEWRNLVLIKEKSTS